jgi:hypothetical protein
VNALTWCLDKKTFVRMQGSTTPLDDRDLGLLTYLFPNLDPWGSAVSMSQTVPLNSIYLSNDKSGTCYFKTTPLFVPIQTSLMCVGI